MGNASSSISRRHEEAPETHRSRRFAEDSPEEVTTQTGATDQCEVISSDHSTSPQRKRSRFSSLRNPFRTKESRTQRSTTSNREEAASSQGRRNRGITTPKRRRTRSVFETECQGVGNSSVPNAQLLPQDDSTTRITLPTDLTVLGGEANQSAPSVDLAPPIRPDYSLEYSLGERPSQVTTSSEIEHSSSAQAVFSNTSHLGNEEQTNSAVTSLTNSASASQTTLSNDEISNSIVPQRRRHNAINTNDSRNAQHRRAGQPAASSRPVSRRSNSSNDGHTRSGDVVSPMPGEDQAGMLSRLLSVAAAATAASLVGHDNRQALRDAREVAIGADSTTNGDAQVAESNAEAGANDVQATEEQDGGTTTVDGSFDGFLAALQSGRLAQALRNGGNVMGGGSNEVGPQQPLNFFRMFRFSNAVNIQGSPATTDVNGRMIPIIIVGIRSVPARDENSATPTGLPPFFDALGSLDALRNGVPPLDVSSQTDGSSATQNNNDLPGTAPATEGERSTSAVPEIVSAVPFTHATDSATSANQAEAFRRPLLASRDSASSRVSARESRRGTRPMSGIMDSVMDHLRSFRSDSADDQTTASETVRRHRRRSTWRPFSSHDGRETEEEEADNSLGATRSWIIYVLGGTYPENHPILTTPSLFTDSPTYEDMLLLSNLIGPAKPETASAADIESAGPTYTISVDNPQIIERCQICLADYEVDDTCRKLTKCSHYFHRECIDEWLTTGRNNCPLCRTETAARTQEIAGDESTTPAVANSPTQPEAIVPEVEQQS